MIIKLCKVLLLPMARAQALRRDDRAQVMVVTGVMVFVAAIFTIQMLNTSEMIYNRIRAQNAADAAADAFALWQARAINTMQFVNDVHYTADMVAYWIAMPACTARMGCALLSLIPIVGPGLKEACCIITLIALDLAEAIQMATEALTLTLQWFLKYSFPAFGIIRANSVAEGNGADPLLSAMLSTLQGMLNQVAGSFINLNKVVAGLNKIPGLGDLYTLPLRPDLAYPLHVRPKIPTPGGMPWEMPEVFMNLCKSFGCFPSVTCLGSNSKSNPPGLMAIGEELQLGIKPLTSSDCGWDDTYYYGYPGFNTWIAGVQSRDAVKGLTHNPWMNPGRGLKSPERIKVTYRGVIRGESGFRHKRGSVKSWTNPGFLGWASSQIEGDPLMESSSSDWTASRPKLITVHIPQYSTDENATNNDGARDLETMLIYH